MRVRLMAVALACATLAGCGTPEQLAGPNWVGPKSSPAGREFTPEAASRRNIAGWVMLLCKLGEGQTARECRVIAETPTGWGFGTAALKMRDGFKITSASSFPGQHVPALGESFQLPVMFCPPDDAGCAPRFHDAVIDFNRQAVEVRRQVRAGDCVAAVKAAAGMGQPVFRDFIEAACSRPR